MFERGLVGCCGVVMGCLAIFHGHTRKALVVVIALAVAVHVSSCGAIELEPILFKGSLSSFGQVAFEFADSLAEFVEPYEY